MRYPEETAAAAVAAYEANGNAKQIAAQHGMTPKTVYDMVRRKGGRVRTVSESRRIYSIDERFFEQIDTHEKAQVLGFIYADGSLCMRNETSGTLAVALSQLDTNYVHWIRQAMKNESPVKLSQNNPDGVMRYVATITTSHPNILRDIQRLGVTPRKSLTVTFPTPEQVPDAFIWSFVRGAFEGDGCLYLGRNRGGPTFKPAVNVIGSVPFIEGLAALFARTGLSASVRRFKTKDGTGTYASVWINAVADVLRFGELIYEDAAYAMERKRVLFDQLRSRYAEEIVDGQKQYRLLQRKEISPEGKKRIGAASRTRGLELGRSIGLKDPAGRVYWADGIKPFCREMGLHHAHAADVWKGKALTHKGWTKPTEAEIAAARTNGTLIEKSYRGQPIPYETRSVSV